MTDPLKPGPKTTEFLVTILTALLPLGTAIWHQDFSGYVQAVAAGISGVVTLVYILSRTFVKKAAIAAGGVPLGQH
jgi:hypothetical protein